jgi:hypothetical protein
MSRGFTVLDVEQRSPAWMAARLGRLTGSRAADMLATVKGRESIGRAMLREQLAAERRTGRSHASTFISAPMMAGLQHETAARAWYEALTGRLVTRSGFVAHDTLQAGVSLDGHVGDFEGLVEIKCPLALTHADYMTARGKVPGDHYKQIVHGLWLTGARWCDWVSFHPEYPPALRAVVVRVERDEKAIASYALAVALFLREVDVAELAAA